ncbi:MAG: hypothetical protein ACR2HF_02555 [Methylococcaceae bacterium]
MSTTFIGRLGFASLVLFGSSSAWSDVPIRDVSEIAGIWQLESVAASLTKPKIEENRTWEFKPEGVIVTSGFNRHFGSTDRHEWKFEIVDGKIVSENPGRPGKDLEYVIYEKTNDTMILKGGLEGFYFFKKK